MGELELLGLLKAGGPIVLLLGFMLWRDKTAEEKREARDREREERLGKRLDDMSDRYAVTMETIVKDNTAAMNKTAQAVDSLAQIVRDNHTPRLGPTGNNWGGSNG